MYRYVPRRRHRCYVVYTVATDQLRIRVQLALLDRDGQ